MRPMTLFESEVKWYSKFEEDDLLGNPNLTSKTILGWRRLLYLCVGVDGQGNYR